MYDNLTIIVHGGVRPYTPCVLCVWVTQLPLTTARAKNFRGRAVVKGNWVIQTHNTLGVYGHNATVYGNLPIITEIHATVYTDILEIPSTKKLGS